MLNILLSWSEVVILLLEGVMNHLQDGGDAAVSLDVDAH